MKFIVYDFETSGLNYWTDIPLDGSFVLCDENLNKLDEFSFKIKLPFGIIPSPIALITQKADINKMYEGDSYYTAIAKLYQKSQEWGPACWIGFNSVQFDEKFLRMSLYKNVFDQYITNTKQNTRTDLLPIMHLVKMFSPNSINFPLTDEGKPIFKLESLTSVNNISHKAHRSMGDVIATIKLASLIKTRCPDLWNIATHKTKKDDLIKRADELIAFCYGGYNKKRDPDFGVYAFIGVNTKMNYELIAFNLKYNLKKYLNLDIQTLIKMVRASDGPFKVIKANESPILLPLEYASKINNKFDEEKLLKKAHQIRDNYNFRSQIVMALEKSKKTYPKSQLVERQIYDNFYSEEDKNLMAIFHEGIWDDKIAISENFKDQRLKELSKLVIFHEKPEMLDKQSKSKIAYNLAARVTSVNRQPWRTIDDAIRELGKELVIKKLSHKELDEYEDFYKKISFKYTDVMEKRGK